MITLPRRLDAAAASALAAELLDKSRLGDLHIDASATTHIGALGAQVLLSAHRSMQDMNKDFRISHMQVRARAHLSSMGLAELIPPEEDT